MKYIVVRVHDERSSQLCSEIEALALQKGGLEFPFQYKGNYYDSNTLNTGLSAAGQTHTRVFHENCRCSLVPISSDSFFRYSSPDELDMHMMVEGALAHSSDMDLATAIDVTEDSRVRYSTNKIGTLLKIYLSRLFRIRKNQL